MSLAMEHEEYEDAMDLLPEEMSKPPPGIVLPPKDIRAIVEKTAGYVARNGPVFEDRIRVKEKMNAKFSFLDRNDPYGPFYQWRLDEVRSGRGTAVSAGREDDRPDPKKPKGPPEPAELCFSARMPNINSQDFSVVNLTALFIAKKGKSFMTALSQREARNYQFDFLRPNHSLYQFFARLVDQYTELIQADSAHNANLTQARIAELRKNLTDRSGILERAKQRAEWVQYQEHQKQQKEEEAEKEQKAYAEIDWHDFIIVETVVFSDSDEQEDLPPPTSLNDLQSASLEEKAMMSLQPANRRIEEAMPGEKTYYNPHQPQPSNVERSQPPETLPSVPVQARVQPKYQPAKPGLPQSVYQPYPTPVSLPLHAPGRSEEEEAISARQEAQERAAAVRTTAAHAHPMRIRNDYVPRAQAKRTIMHNAICPNCHQTIPINELDQHMRIELLDPRWKSQRERAVQLAQTTNLSTVDVARNLKRLVSQRTDVFEKIEGMPSEGDANGGFDNDYNNPRRKRPAGEMAVMTSMIGAIPQQPPLLVTNKPVNIEEQLRHIKEKAKK